ncbi:unnamed protein product [Didymodactylos carnosus]|uniref:Uncharacterized protein n=1 Tax=Didymodactylos carnosus TaxID=1234261 RepID=A0A814GFH6_9BILA|nr:unnamed protein product [Didymodactylos carnosus]CAF1366912.1 unnamed protein product [Didymodactylos carnosus]CAF3767336.1 unnamed protein product [Didymodactylos carnosus]CAF4176168.1 unnamed protein product [Didymodactylos carnosus]
MTLESNITFCIKLIQYCVESAEQVKANKILCSDLATDLAVVHDILKSLNPVEKQQAEKHRLRAVLVKLCRITGQTKILFERSKSGKKRIKVKNFLQAVSIQDELRRLKAEMLVVITMFNLVFNIKQQSDRYRGYGINAQLIDETIFDQEDEKDNQSAEDYYVVDDD